MSGFYMINPASVTTRHYEKYSVLSLCDKAGWSADFHMTAAQAQAMADAFNASATRPITEAALEAAQ